LLLRTSKLRSACESFDFDPEWAKDAAAERIADVARAIVADVADLVSST